MHTGLLPQHAVQRLSEGHQGAVKDVTCNFCCVLFAMHLLQMKLKSSIKTMQNSASRVKNTNKATLSCPF